MSDKAKPKQSRPGTLTLQWAVDIDPSGDGDLRPVQAKWSELSDSAKAALRDELQRLTDKLPDPE